MPNPVVHFEIQTSNAEKVQEFYRNLFDWHVDTSNPMEYGIVDTHTERGINGGIGGTGPADHPNRVTFYVEVDDLEASLNKAQELGGKTMMPVTVIPNMATFALFSDPEGNVVGLVKSEEG